jgi:hypothetical protein
MKIRFAIFALTLSFALPLQAQTLYHVEIIAFAREGAAADQEESWSKRPNLRYPERTTILQTNGSGSNTFQQLPAEMWMLNNEATTIKNRRGMRLLTHVAWLQPGEAASVLIVGGKQFGNHYELEGSFTLGVENFLKVDVNMWFNRFLTNAAGDTVVLPNIPGTVIDPTSTASSAAQTVQLQEQRRMRNAELHYFDHPKFGLLVMVKPVPPSNAQ